MVALASLVLVAVTCALYFLAIPWAADALVRTMGRDTEARLFGSALKQWDDASVWGPSALSARQQEGIRSQLLNSLGADVLKSEAIHFRASSTLGPNAMALPGGHIVITDALIALLSAEELSAVVAHEAGHMHHRHGVRMMARQMGVSGFMAMVGSALGHHDMAATLATQLGVTRYSREFESQADAFAMDAMQASGLSPCLLASALRKLEAVSTTGAPSHSSWLSTHPSTQDRIGRVAAMAHAQCSPS
jgi:Zn-dependent protease with chaperone function